MEWGNRRCGGYRALMMNHSYVMEGVGDIADRSPDLEHEQMMIYVIGVM